MAYSEASANAFTAPVFLGSLFAEDGDDAAAPADSQCAPAAAAAAASSSGPADASADRTVDAATGLRYEITQQQFPSMTLQIRQFDDHHRNANICWPEARCLAEWLIGQHLAETLDSAARKARFDAMLIGFDSGRTFPSDTVAASEPAALAPPACPACDHPRRQLRVFELGAATGALVLFLAALGVDIHSSDIDDVLVTDNIRFNAGLNGLRVPVHLAHSWGVGLERVDEYVQTHGAPDVLLGSDILAYDDDFDALANTIEHLMPAPGAAGAASGAAAASAASSAVPASASACVACHPPAVFYMCWKRSHDKTALDGFWRGMSERGFVISTRGNKTYEIRRGVRESSNSSWVQFVK